MSDDEAVGGIDLEAAEALVLGAGARYTPRQLWEAVGVDEDLARHLWLAMGFPSVPDDEASLTERDLDALRRAGDLLAGGVFAVEQLVAQTRVMSQALSTIATAHVETLAASTGGGGFLAAAGLVGLVDPRGVRDLGEPGEPAGTPGLAAIPPAGEVGASPAAGDVGQVGASPPAGEVGVGARAAELGPDAVGEVLSILDELLSYLYRRHLLAALERARLAGEPDRRSLPETVVGFADLTDFAATAARASEEELTELVDDFATVAADLVASAGGRVVKLIGDEVMFSVEDPAAAAELALALVEEAQGSEIPPVHVGLARGPVLSHHGDLFGSTVNTASRLSDVARPGSVLVNASLADALGGVEGVSLRRVHLRSLKGLGHVPAFLLRRAPAAAAGRVAG